MWPGRTLDVVVGTLNVVRIDLFIYFPFLQGHVMAGSESNE